MHVVRLVSSRVGGEEDLHMSRQHLEAVHVKLLIQRHGEYMRFNHGDKKVPLSFHFCWEQSNLNYTWAHLDTGRFHFYYIG